MSTLHAPTHKRRRAPRLVPGNDTTRTENVE